MRKEMRQAELDGCPARAEPPFLALFACEVRVQYSTVPGENEKKKKKEVRTQTPAGVNKTKSSFTAKRKEAHNDADPLTVSGSTTTQK
jgi:hypothetical protein